MSMYGPSDKSDSSRRNDDQEDLFSSVIAPRQESISEHIQAMRQNITELLLSAKSKPNELQHVQALKERAPEDESAIRRRAEKQTSQLIAAETLSNHFAEKKALYESFIKVIRGKIAEPKVTQENAKAALLLLKAQFENKDTDRERAVSLTIRLEKAKAEVKSLEKQSNEKPAAQSSNSSAVKEPVDHLAIAKDSVEALTKDVQEAKTAAEKATDIPMEYRSNFLTFVTHALRVLPFIVHELQFAKPDSELTQVDIDVASEAYKDIAEAKAARLANVERNGGKFVGIQARVADWNDKMPKALSSDEMTVRNRIHPHHTDEQKEHRDERIRLISGLPFTREQIKEKAVARDKALARKQIAAPVAKQLHELPDPIRREFEQVGIKPYSKNQQNPFAAVIRAATGVECWNTEFEDRPTPKSPTPPRRTMMEKNVPEAFPQRKEHYKKCLMPLLERHQQIGGLEGYLVGQKSKPNEEYLKPVGSAELDELVANLRKVKI